LEEQQFIESFEACRVESTLFQAEIKRTKELIERIVFEELRSA
jgi:hypothetical protein